MPAQILSAAAAPKLQRVDTLDLKDKLTKALGPRSPVYWQGLRDFCSARLTRSEFEEQAQKLLKSEHVHLHNSLLLGLLYNASPGVPGPSSTTAAKSTRKAGGSEIDHGEDKASPRKRMRLLVAGLNKKERSRLKSLAKGGKGGIGSTSSEKANLDWAGAGADLLEKKRKEDERKKALEDKKRYREAQTAVGAMDWRTETLHRYESAESARRRLPLSVQQALSRGMTTPLCIHTKELPTIESLRDRMTMHAVENGLPGGVHPQAAAMVLTALQSHLQTIAGSALGKVRFHPDASTATHDVEPTFQLDEPHRSTPTPIDLDRDSPAPRLALARADGSPTRALVPDMSFRTSTYGGSSMGDTSMVSLVSTAPTSASFAAGSAASSVGGADADGATMSDAGQGGSADGGPRNDKAFGVTLSDLSFLFESVPHTLVEPLGLGTSERLLAPDWEEEEVDRQTRTAAEAAMAKAARETATAKMSAAPANAPPEVLSSELVTSLARSRFAIDQSAPLRLLDPRTFTETQALKLAKLHPKDGSANNRPSVGGLSLAASATVSGAGIIASTSAGVGDAAPSSDAKSGGKADALTVTTTKRKDGSKNSQLWEVVDPVALLSHI
ncbi:hypothetical protein K437DRAFT_274346 [Tilletiaria anomala UBC 951]|uniref:Uncharacterized protein n=1 Tax=Tilletiaria anomala (strain ATCC 24038 / CBS 436.72 / UBC 951) TaxID=1037660 RepID=A0A066VTN7_TILAU|nr:uncharacterized protein K437DRAFT_274346 [Tilletiaria anomala UBC 951]KDN45092.1 hypothetical protein K437DRAFT_274346 [Tilletiaria anomala UBC 951]